MGQENFTDSDLIMSHVISITDDKAPESNFDNIVYLNNDSLFLLTKDGERLFIAMQNSIDFNYSFWLGVIIAIMWVSIFGYIIYYCYKNNL